MKKVLISTFVLLVLSTSLQASFWCKASGVKHENTGSCVKGTDNKGKCLDMTIKDAVACSDDGGISSPTPT